VNRTTILSLRTTIAPHGDRRTIKLGNATAASPDFTPRVDGVPHDVVGVAVLERTQVGASRSSTSRQEVLPVHDQSDGVVTTTPPTFPGSPTKSGAEHLWCPPFRTTSYRRAHRTIVTRPTPPICAVATELSARTRPRGSSAAADVSRGRSTTLRRAPAAMLNHESFGS
jgi:hypothetical protein